MFDYRADELMKDFRKYVNRKLRYDAIVEDWFFHIGEDKYQIYIQIDWLGNFHSRDLIHLRIDMDIDYTIQEFEFLYNKHRVEFMKDYLEKEIKEND